MINYDEIYARNPRYRMGTSRKAWLRDQLADASGSTFLDVGCGRGEALRFATDAGFDALGIEFAASMCGPNVQFADACALPFTDESFDVVSALDVLEHLSPEQVPIALRELRRVARRCVLISIGLGSAIDAATGAELHLTQISALDWVLTVQAEIPSAYLTQSSQPRALFFRADIPR